MLIVLVVATVAAVIVVGILAWRGRRPPVELTVGGLYSVDSGEGFFRVAKVLAVDDEAVHVRLYANKFDARPQDVNPSTLTLGNVRHEESPGIGHMPLSAEVFLASRPVFLREAAVEEEELEGYEMWKQSGGGIWGQP